MRLKLYYPSMSAKSVMRIVIAGGRPKLVLAALPSKLAALSLSAAGRFNHPPSLWLGGLSAPWLLLSHDRWKEITGDVSGAELARTIASLQHPHPETVGQPLFAPAQCA